MSRFLFLCLNVPFVARMLMFPIFCRYVVNKCQIHNDCGGHVFRLYFHGIIGTDAGGKWLQLISVFCHIIIINDSTEL